jgi:XTP/dITP diphosphohydrolase
MAADIYPLLIGTTNAGKGRELVELLAPHGFVVRTLQDFPPQAEVVEDGDTFAANARKKASDYARRLGLWVLADDSGLEVAALDGRPGVYSARYAGADATDAANNARLLAELGELPPEKRGARYYCHVAVADPRGEIRAESWDVCGGRIRTAAAGRGGFGYDPLFEIVELHRTFGELGPHVKAALSHRGRAMRAIVPKLRTLADSGAWEIAE